jgi:hypothetical protein
MRQTSTDHRRIHRIPSKVAGTQFCLDAYSHGNKSYRGFKYCDMFTDLNTGRVYPVFTKDRGAEELCHRSAILFDSHPEWRSTGSDGDRFIRVDPELSYRSTLFMQHASKYGYRIEPTPARDKHANGVAERTVGAIASKTNLAMLAPSPPVPNKFWDLCFEYACVTAAFNYHRKIGTSPYNFITGMHVNVKHLRAFWSRCYVHISLEDRKGKVGYPRAYKAYMVGYEFPRTLEPTYKVIQVYPNGTYGKLRISKDVIFDDMIDFKTETGYPTDSAFNVGIDEQDKSVPHTPPVITPPVLPAPIIPAALPKALPRQDARPVKAPDARLAKPFPTPAGLIEPQPPRPIIAPTHPVPTPPALAPPVQAPPAPGLPKSGERSSPDTLTRSQRRPITFNRVPTVPPSSNIDIDTLRDNEHIVHNEEEDMVYWYSTSVRNHEHSLHVIETSHFLTMNIAPEPHVPKDFWKAMAIPEWNKAIDTELIKFEANNCLQYVPDTGQHLVPMMWLFSIKTDGTRKARLVGRGDLMIPLVDFNPDAVYCGNVSACSIKIALTIAGMYCLVMRGGDLVGAYLITRANPDFPVFIKTPQGYQRRPGFVVQAIGNLYGFPPAGQNFSIEFDKCLEEAGYKNTPWDLKLFFKWTKAKKPMIIIAHSDDFRWFGPEENLDEWDSVVKIFNKHGYQVTDATDKEFVGIKITRDEQFNYYMDQHRMIDSIIAEANMTGAKDEHLPYPNDIQQPPLSKLDCAQTDEEKIRASKYPYRRVVGQLMYGMVHTMVCIMYALNVLSRYGNNPGDRHIAFLKHLLRYVKYSKKDRLKFKSHPGPWDIETMTPLMQLHFQCDADLGGNRDNDHSQTSYLGYLAGNLICWCSTDQGSISTSTAESEIKAVNHTLKAEVIANRGILREMGWEQEPTRIEEDNQAAIYHSKATHMTRNLRHLDLCTNWIKEKVQDKTCVLVKVASADNNSDIGTKRVPISTFTRLTSQIVDRSLRNNL